MIELRPYLLASLVLLAPLAAVPVAARAETLQLQGFSIDVPAGWRAVPSAEVGKFNAKTVKRTGKSQNFEYAFQPLGAKRWFDLPYILIRRHTGGRWTQADIDKTDADFAAAGQKYTDRYKKLISQFSSKKGSYDQDLQIVWKVFEIHSPQTGPVNGLSATKLTSNGYIQIVAYDRRSQFPGNAPMYTAMIESVKLSPSLRYNSNDRSAGGPPPAAGNTNSLFGLEQLLALLVMAVLGTLLVRNFKAPNKSGD